MLFWCNLLQKVPTDQAKNKNESLKMKFDVTKVRLSCLSDLVRNWETVRIARLLAPARFREQTMKAMCPNPFVPHRTPPKYLKLRTLLFFYCFVS